jgi:N-acetyl-anhydromuramyl-L-alanine amidase AmpD
MWNGDVETIYPWIKVGTPVIVLGNPFGNMEPSLSRLGSGVNGASTFFMQDKLKQLGYLHEAPDGIYGQNTAKAVKEFQKATRLRQTGEIYDQEYEKFGLVKLIKAN